MAIFDRLLRRIRNQHGDASRVFRANDPVFNSTQGFAVNRISTTKYNLITFLPKNLFEQFRRLANIFFLFLLCLLYIPQVSSLQPITTLLSLVFVLAVTAVKDGVDDFARYRSDRQVNNRRTEVLVGNELARKYWRELRVGEIVKLNNNEFIPADVIVLSSSEPNGLCFIETADLDGETNLKPRQARAETVDLKDDLEQLSCFDARIECEPANENLIRFEGNLSWKGHVYSLKNDHLLLRGTRLRNTPWVFGVICYAGRETKLMQNSGKAKFKRTKIDHWMNTILIGIFVFLFLFCTITAIGCGFWEDRTGVPFGVYLPRESFISSSRRTGSIQIGLLVFLSYVILLNTVVPTSLYICIEIIRLMQSKWISWDNQMYDASRNIPAEARTASLNEELGQIDYILTDKTGTLTQNIMTFKQCSIRGHFYEQIEAMKTEDEHFFPLLALCHTVVSEEKNGQVIYQAQSPDENALVTAARAFGFEFLTRTQNSIAVRFHGELETYDLLNILDFNNYRKRMSVIVRKHGRILLYCKGADSVIKERLASSERDLMAITDEHLHKVARHGLRTLCLAWKEINASDYQNWAKKMQRATTSLQKREEQVEALYEEIEKNFTLIGMTAIEDKLQEGVPRCIERLTKAKIKIWMLTGDKVETAENIAFSCRLLTDRLLVERIEGETEDEVRRDLERCRDGERDTAVGLLITGSALVHALSKPLELNFLELARRCRTVICCRVTPLQKAQLVELIIKHEKKITLAIGDGANDVSMIQKAHIGVGISGQEGRQAVLASDFSIGQFRFLERLLLVHGRWSYLRLAKFLRYFFYKNFAFTFCQFWFGIFCGFSAQTIFDAFFVTTYNIFFSTLPVLILGIFDQDISANHSISRPHLYTVGPQDRFFNRKIFFGCALHGLLTSAVIFFVAYLCLLPSTHTHPSGLAANDIQSFGFMIATILIFVVNLENALEMWYWTGGYIFVLFGTIVLYFIFPAVLYSVFLRQSLGVNYDYVGVTRLALSTGSFWFTLLLICAIILLPIVAQEFVRMRFFPTETDEARLAQKFHGKKLALSSNTVEPAPRPRSQSIRSNGSGYAFSQAKGLGALITSGSLRSKSSSMSRPSQH